MLNGVQLWYKVAGRAATGQGTIVVLHGDWVQQLQLRENAQASGSGEKAIGSLS